MILDRKSILSRVHDGLRSDENLRPEEALDALTELFRVWVRAGSTDAGSALRESALPFGEASVARATSQLWPLLERDGVEHGADIFQALADVGVRSGLGQYFTPRPVAQAMARLLAPQEGETWLDPFCGSATLLGCCAGEHDEVEILGLDRDPRVLKLAEVEAELNRHSDRSVFREYNAFSDPVELLEVIGRPDGVDGIVTNPPFGMSIAGDTLPFDDFELLDGATPLEFLAVEQCARLLKPGGRMGIVLPQSVLSNKRASRVRRFISKNFVSEIVLSLPTETFLPFGGVAKASVLVLRRVDSTPVNRVAMGVSTRIGWDASGRRHGTADLADVADALRVGEDLRQVQEVNLDHSQIEFNLTAEWNLRAQGEGFRLDEIAEEIFVGATPSRADYADPLDVPEDAARILKVADLTGHGIDWTPGDRSFAKLKKPNQSKFIRDGDIVLTSSAHHPRYIAAKVDLIDGVDTIVGRHVFPSAEVMVIRVRPEFDARRLLLWLRTDEGRAAMQACVTGQTAHLRANYVAQVRVPQVVFDADLSAALESLERAIRARRQSEKFAIDSKDLFHVAVKRPDSLASDLAQ